MDQFERELLVFCTYQQLIEKQETKIAKQILENIGYGLGVTP